MKHTEFIWLWTEFSVGLCWRP